MTQASAKVLDQKYKLGKVLHQGERALTVEALHVELREPVAIKVLDAEERDPRFAARLRRSARQSATIKSAHVVRYLDIGHLTDGRPYVVMEKLTGESLRDRLARQPLTFAEVIEVMLQTCEALASAHVRGVLHRDLRTSNVFLTEQPDGSVFVKVMNFGTARSVDQLTGNEEDQGMTVAALALEAPDYKSPEQIVARRDLDARVDVWALGVVLYEMLTGRLPFAASTLQDTVRRILSAEIAPAPGVPGELWAIVDRCLRPSPDQRFANVGEVAAALAPYATPATSRYPARIQQILETPPRQESNPDFEDPPEATVLKDVLALSREATHATSTKEIPRTDTGLPRVDNGRTAARSFPWISVAQLKGTAPANAKPEGGTNPWAIALVFIATLLSILLALVVVVPRFVLDVHVGSHDPQNGGRPASTSPITQAAAPPPTMTVRRAAEPAPTATATDEPTPAPPPAAARAKVPAAPARSPAAASTSTKPTRGRSTKPEEDPWGWER